MAPLYQQSSRHTTGKADLELGNLKTGLTCLLCTARQPYQLPIEATYFPGSRVGAGIIGTRLQHGYRSVVLGHIFYNWAYGAGVPLARLLSSIPTAPFSRSACARRSDRPHALYPRGTPGTAARPGVLIACACDAGRPISGVIAILVLGIVIITSTTVNTTAIHT